MKKIHSENNFIFFTATLVGVLLASAVVGSTPTGENHRLIQGALLLTQLVAFFSLNLGGHWREFVALILILMLTSNGIREFTAWPEMPLISLTTCLLFFCGMAYAAARQVLFSGAINHNTIVGTASVFLLLGLIWAMMYLIALEYWPDGIQGIEPQNWHENLGAAIYFSFITMTSTGYGDIVPTLQVTRTLAYLQAIVGTFYMAVVVASLVGSFHRIKVTEN